MKILLADDHHLLRDGLKFLIRRLGDDESMLQARITAVSLRDGGRPYFPEQLENLFD